MTEITRNPRHTGPRPMRNGDPYHPVYEDTGNDLPAVKKPPGVVAPGRHAPDARMRLEFFSRSCAGHPAGMNCNCP